MISGAMETARPGNDRFWAFGQWRERATLSTSLMVHIEGKGPRRVYISRRTGQSFIVMKRRRRYLSEAELSEASRRAERKE